MEDKDFAERVLSVIKNNLFEFKKLFFNLDDCVSKNDFDNLQENFSAARNEIADLQQNKSRLENEVADKSQKFQQAQSEIDNLQSQLDRQRDELSQSENNLAQAKEEISKLIQQLEDKKSLLAEKTAQLQKYADNYAELENAYNSYKKLSDQTKIDLKGVFGEENSPTTFLSGALQEKNLGALFDYIANKINNHADDVEIEILKNLFDFAFNAINSSRREKLFDRLVVNEGEDFDGESMRKTSDSSQSGTVKNILLVGYKFCRTGNVENKSLVRVA